MELYNKEMDKWFNSEKGKKYFASIQFKRERKQHYIDKYTSIINNMSDVELSDMIDKIIIWENKYETMKYTHGIEASSNIFNLFFEIWAKNGKANNFDALFLSASFTWKKYTFNLYHGQGSVFKLIKNNKIIF